MRVSRTRADVAGATQSVLDELARLLVSAGVGFGEFADAARYAFVRAVADALRSDGQRVTRSAIAAATGLTRQEVAGYLEHKGARNPQPRALTRARRLAEAWRSDPQLRNRALWLDARGAKRREPSFSTLVRRAGGDVPPRAMQNELLRAGLATLTDDGRITLRIGSIPHEARALEALRSAVPWLKAVSVPAAAQATQQHASLRWAETHWTSERELLVALQRTLRARDRLIRPRGARRGSGTLAVGVAVVANLDKRSE
jgi:hypothetical protein